MMMTVGGERITITQCELCDAGRLVFNSTGKRIGHYQRARVHNIAGVTYEVSEGCPGNGKRAYGCIVVGRLRSLAIMAAIRSILATSST